MAKMLLFVLDQRCTVSLVDTRCLTLPIIRLLKAELVLTFAPFRQAWLIHDAIPHSWAANAQLHAKMQGGRCSAISLARARARSAARYFCGLLGPCCGYAEASFGAAGHWRLGVAERSSR